MFKKIRDNLGEFKVYAWRLGTYVQIFNFLMIFLVFLTTVLWPSAFIQGIFPNISTFLIVGLGICVILSAILVYLDKKTGLHLAETSRLYSAKRNPSGVWECFKCAKMLNELKREGRNMAEFEEWLTYYFQKADLDKEWKKCLEATK